MDKNASSIYKRTPIYAKQSVSREDSKVVIRKNAESPTSCPVKVAQKFQKPLVKNTRKMIINIRESSYSDVRIAAWDVSKSPYTMDNALVNTVVNVNNAVVIQHNCFPGTNILIRARAVHNEQFVGPMSEYIHVVAENDDVINFPMKG